MRSLFQLFLLAIICTFSFSCKKKADKATAVVHLDSVLRYYGPGQLRESEHFFYDLNNNVVKRVRWGYTYPGTMPTIDYTRYTFEYDNKQRMVTENLVDENGSVITSYEFTYDNAGRLQKETMRDYYSQQVTEYVDFLYAADNKLSSVVFRDASAGATIGEVTLTYSGNNVSHMTGLDTERSCDAYDDKHSYMQPLKGLNFAAVWDTQILSANNCTVTTYLNPQLPPEVSSVVFEYNGEGYPVKSYYADTTYHSYEVYYYSHH